MNMGASVIAHIAQTKGVRSRSRAALLAESSYMWAWAMLKSSIRIRRARTLAGLTQAALASRLGVQRTAVTQWECERGTSPSVEHMSQIAHETEVCFEWLATGRGPCRPETGAFDAAVIREDFAHNELESRILQSLRRVSGRKREILVHIVEMLST